MRVHGHAPAVAWREVEQRPVGGEDPVDQLQVSCSLRQLGRQVQQLGVGVQQLRQHGGLGVLRHQPRHQVPGGRLPAVSAVSSSDIGRCDALPPLLCLFQM